MSTYGRFRGAASPLVVWDGQSYNSTPAAPTIPETVMTGLDTAWERVSIDGAGWELLADTVTTRRDPYARRLPPTVLVMNGGQGDILGTGSPAVTSTAEMWDRIVDYATTARAAGFTHIVGVTMAALGPNVLGTGLPTVAAAAARLGANALLLADTSGLFDAVADVGAVINDGTNTTIYAVDSVHLKAVGAAIAAGIIRPVLEDLLDSL